MAKRHAGGPGQGYDGPEYDPVYGPPFDPALGEPVSPPLLRRTQPRNPRRTALVAISAAVAVAVVAVVAVVVLRGSGDDRPAAAPPSPTVTDVPRGQSERLVEGLTANGFRCAAQFTGPAGARRGCFATRVDTILAAAIFEDDAAGTVSAVRLSAHDLSRSPALNARTLAVVDDLAELFGPVVFPGDQANALAQLRRRSMSTKGAWGNFRLGNRGDAVELYADKTGRTALTPVTPQLATPRTVLVGELTRTGWRCAASCGKTGQWVNTDIHLDGADELTGIRLTVTGTGPLETTRTGFHAQVANLLGLLDGEGVPELKAWLDDQRDRGSGGGYVRGWRVWVEALYVGDRPAGYRLRLSTEPRLA